MHKRFITLMTLPLYLTCASTRAGTTRCGSALVSVGDRTLEVQQKCGDPSHRDDVGYTLGSYDRQGFKVKEWVYSPCDGVIYILIFEANKLKRIKPRR